MCPLRVRCGLHLGVVERRDNDFFGTRRQSRRAHHGGGARRSGAAVAGGGRSVCAGPLPASVVAARSGTVRLRGSRQSPEHVYQVVHPQLRQDFPALRSLEATPNNLPQQVTSFVGRERELAEVKTLLGKTRLVTLLGVGGLGKTRLSLQWRPRCWTTIRMACGSWNWRRWRMRGSCRRRWRRCSGSRKRPGDRCRSAAEVRQGPATAARARQLRTPGAGLRRAGRGSLLQAGPQVKVLATSREPLHVAGETTYQVPALSVPTIAEPIGALGLTQYEAVRLFVDRARRGAAGVPSLTTERARGGRHLSSAGRHSAGARTRRGAGAGAVGGADRCARSDRSFAC